MFNNKINIYWIYSLSQLLLLYFYLDEIYSYWNMLYVLSIFYKKNIYISILNFILKFNRINYQVDGLMAGRPFWEGELGVRISTAWSMKFILIFVDDLIFLFSIIHYWIIESYINMRYSYLKIESILFHSTFIIWILT